MNAYVARRVMIVGLYYLMGTVIVGLLIPGFWEVPLCFYMGWRADEVWRWTDVGD